MFARCLDFRATCLDNRCVVRRGLHEPHCADYGGRSSWLVPVSAHAATSRRQVPQSPRQRRRQPSSRLRTENASSIRRCAPAIGTSSISRAPAPRHAASRIIRGSTTTPRCLPTAGGSYSRRSGAAIPISTRSSSKAAREPRLLIDSAAMEDQVAFSPDGRSIAFVSTASGNADIYVLPFVPETTQNLAAATNVTNDPGGDFRPDFSPDGARIAFSTDRDTPVSGHPIFAFTRQREGDVYVMDRDGGNSRRLTATPDWDGSPEWSADGAHAVLLLGAAARDRRPADEPDLGPRGRLSDLGDERRRLEPARRDAGRRRSARAGRDAGRPHRVSEAHGLCALEHRVGRRRRLGRARRERHGDRLLAAGFPRCERRDGRARRRSRRRRRRKPSRRFSAPARCSRPTIPRTSRCRTAPSRCTRCGTRRVLRRTRIATKPPSRSRTRRARRLVLADFDGANQRELFAVPERRHRQRHAEPLVRHQVVRRRRVDHVHARVLLRPGDGRGRHLGHARGRLRAAQLERGHDRQRRRRGVLAGRRAARVPQRAQRPIRSCTRASATAPSRRRSRATTRARTFPCSRRTASTIAFSSNRDGARDQLGNLTFDNYLLARRAGRHARRAAADLGSSGSGLAPVVLAGRRVDRLHVGARRHQRRGADGAGGRVRPADVRRAVRAAPERRARGAAHAQQVGRRAIRSGCGPRE